MTYETYNHLERLSNLLRVDARKAGVEYGLQPVQLEVLHYVSIANRYSDTPKAVTEYLGQTKGTVSQTINILEREGLLSKQVDANDKRVSHLKVTNKGRQVLENAIPSPLFESGFQALPAEEQDNILIALRTLLGSIQASNNMQTFGVCKTCRYNQTKSGKSDKSYCDLTKEQLSEADTVLICREHQVMH